MINAAFAQMVWIHARQTEQAMGVEGESHFTAALETAVREMAEREAARLQLAAGLQVMARANLARLRAGMGNLEKLTTAEKRLLLQEAEKRKEAAELLTAMLEELNDGGR